jgi:hypothetical protein
LNSDGEGAHTLIDYGGGGDDALISDVTATTKRRVHSLISRKTKRDRKLKNVQTGQGGTATRRKKVVKDEKK